MTGKSTEAPRRLKDRTEPAKPNEVTVRDYFDRDIRAVTDIYAAQVLTGTGTFEYEAPSPEAMSVRLDRSVRRGLPVLVAATDHGVLGFASAASYSLLDGYRWTAEVSVYVDADHQRQGVGTALLNQLIERCRRTELCELIALMGDRENRASRQLFQNAGFLLIGVGERLGLKFGRPLDVIFMQKSLINLPTDPSRPLWRP